MVQQGDAAPDATLALADGTTKTLADYRGRKLVLYFYPKDDTTGCTAEAQGFSALGGEFAKSDTAVVGVSKDSLKKHGNFIAKYDLKLALASDAEGGLCEAFGTWVEKSMYGRSYMGIERATFLIDREGRVAQVWRKVKVKGHAEEVLAAAQALG